MAQKIQGFVHMKISFDDLGKNDAYTPSSLGGKLIVVERQADNIAAVYRSFKIHMFEWIYSVHGFVSTI